MIEYTQGDILKADVEAIVNTVNCVGVMGRGIALQFKKAWPENFKAYEAACALEEVQPGHMFIFETYQLTNPRYIINFPTKRHWRGASRIEDIESGLKDLKTQICELGIHSVALPPLGAGLGGLDWIEVRSRIESLLSDLPNIKVLVFEPTGAPENDRMVKNRKVPKLTTGRAVLVELMYRYLNGLLDPSISLLEVHKLLYFMQEAGEPLRLKYKKAHYGPYAENLRHVLSAIEGHMISGYADGGDAPDKVIQLVPGAMEDAKKYLENYPETLERFGRVSELVEGFESPDGLELLASVHWVRKHENANSKDDVVGALYDWNSNKKRFSQRQIEIAFDVLEKKFFQNKDLKEIN